MLKSITLTSLPVHAAIVSLAAAQDVVSINLMQNFVAAQTVDPNVPYGVEEVPFWTNSNGNGPLNLRDQTSTPTTLDLTIANGNRNLFGGNNISGTPMKSGQAFFIPNAGPSFTFSEIPYANYKVVVYLTGYNATNTQASISDGTTTYWWRPQPYGPGLIKRPTPMLVMALIKPATQFLGRTRIHSQAVPLPCRRFSGLPQLLVLGLAAFRLSRFLW
jgi:hypothetical protein